MNLFPNIIHFLYVRTTESNRKHRQDSWLLSRDLNLGYSPHEAGMIYTQSRPSVSKNWFSMLKLSPGVSLHRLTCVNEVVSLNKWKGVGSMTVYRLAARWLMTVGRTCRSRETRGYAASRDGGGGGVVPEWENKVKVSYSKIMWWVGQLNETPSGGH